MGSLTITLSDREFLPGDVVSGNLSWRLETSAEALSLHLLWHTEGIGTKDAEVVQTIEIHQAGTIGERDFSFKLPLSPFSMKGTHIAIIWSVEAVCEQDNLLCREDIVVGPGKHAVVLAAIPDSGKAAELQKKWGLR